MKKPVLEERAFLILAPRDGLESLSLERYVCHLYATPNVCHYIVYLKGGIGGQDYIGHDAIVLHPGVLGYDAFYLRASEGFYNPVAVIPAGKPTGGIGPYHMYFSAALFFGQRVCVFYELVFDFRLDCSSSPEGNGRI